MHAVNIVRARLGADENDLPALGLQCLRHLRMKYDLARRGARRSGQSLGDQVVLGGRIDGGMQQLIELRRLDPQNRLVLA